MSYIEAAAVAFWAAANNRRYECAWVANVGTAYYVRGTCRVGGEFLIRSLDDAVRCGFVWQPLPLVA